jgi:hypothetical protein
MFWEDDRVLFISIHQDSNYPLNSGEIVQPLACPNGASSCAHRCSSTTNKEQDCLQAVNHSCGSSHLYSLHPVLAASSLSNALNL